MSFWYMIERKKMERIYFHISHEKMQIYKCRELSGSLCEFIIIRESLFILFDSNNMDPINIITSRGFILLWCQKVLNSLC